MSSLRFSFSSSFANMTMASVSEEIHDYTMVRPFEWTNGANHAEGSGFIDTSDKTVRLVAIDDNGETYALSSGNAMALIGSPLTVDELYVNDNTYLGTGDPSDTVTISATVVGMNCNATFDTVTANAFHGGDGYFDNLYVNINGSHQSYQPFFVANGLPDNPDPYRFWIDNTNENVPIIKYCINVSEANDVNNWVALGAVFG